MAHIKLFYFSDYLNDAKIITNTPPHAININYEGIIRQSGSPSNNSSNGAWFDFGKVDAKKIPEKVKHPKGDFSNNVYLFCKTWPDGNAIDRAAKIVGAPEPPFQGQETSSRIRNDYSYKDLESNYLKFEKSIIAILAEIICENYFENNIIPYYFNNNDNILFQKLERDKKKSKNIQLQHCLHPTSNLGISCYKEKHSCCNIFKNYYVRLFYTEMSFEYELEWFYKNIIDCTCRNEGNCDLAKKILLFIISCYLSLILDNYEKNTYYSEAKINYHQIKDKSLQFLPNYIQNLIECLYDFINFNFARNIDLSKIQILACNDIFGIHENMALSNLVNSNFIQENKIKVYFSHDQQLKSYLHTLYNDDIIFILGHGDENNGVIYKEYESEEYMNSNVFKYNGIKIIGFFTCASNMYKTLHPEICHVILPNDNSSSYEIAEMFIKSFIGCYKRTGDYKMSLKIANYAGQIFPHKQFVYDISGL